MKTEKPKQMPLCKCGCGERLVWKQKHIYRGIPKFIRGHFRTKKQPLKQPKQMPLCGCGCGERIEWKLQYRIQGIPKFINGHNGRKKQNLKQPKQMPLCGCGCGERIEWNPKYKYVGIPKVIHGHYTKEQRKKMSTIKQGIDIKDWNGFNKGIYSQNWNETFRRTIRKRDNQICLLCNVHREKLNIALDVHHIDYQKMNSCKENCISLCHSCHSKTNLNRDEWKLFFQSLLSKRYGYKYIYTKQKDQE